ncbi:hypothetical protein [Pleurocapsa sp. CCALA 161]|uniref:hypothetical protein n=1 Tax=Pleurocapsa sp. CCALA 161 TaxID=2107688 RepID=UPI0018EA7040|nr:hypothetical protein [Pleurocapsa sp. CCALA 161]
MMELHTAKIEQIATQLLAGMLANPEIYSLYPRVNKIHCLDPTAKKKVGREQEEELIMKAIVMAETLVTKVETQIQHRDYFPSPTRPVAIDPIPQGIASS